MSEVKEVEFECENCGKKVKAYKHEDVEFNMLCQQCGMDVQTSDARN